MVSSRLLCVECGDCIEEPYVEVDVDDEDENGRVALKRAIDNVVTVNNGPPLPVVDIRHRWHQVASDGFVALFCSCPMLSIFVARYMVKNYLFARWRLIFPPEHSWGRQLRHWLGSEALMWLMLTDVVLGGLFTCDGSVMGRTDCTAQSAFVSLPVQMLTNALSVTSLLLLRILEVQILDVSAHVHYHKVRARNRLEASAIPDAEGRKSDAMEFLQKLQRSFPETFGKQMPPRTLEQLYRSWDINETPTNLIRMVWCSTLVLFVLLTWLQEAIRQGKMSTGELPELRFESSWDWLGFTLCMLKSYGAAISWFHLVANILCISKGMDQNAKQLLLFSTLTSYSSIESWSRQNREILRSILANALSNNNNVGGDAVITENQLRHALERIIGAEKLDLMNVDDIKAWWELRKYIQVDFLDESAAMDFCGVLTLQLILCFMVTGAFDWLANGDLFSPGINIVVMLVGCLAVLMFNVIQAAININELLEKDSQVLVDAAADCIFSRQWNSAEVAGLLQSIERRVAMLDDKQQILGVTMTATYRNGWVATFLAAGISSLVKLLQTMRLEVMHWMTDGQDLIWNATYYAFMGVANDTMS